MAVSFDRRTLATTVKLEGKGLHSGVPVTVVLRPGDQGIRFLQGGDSVKASPHNVTDTARCTKLGGVSTVEHLMAALAGLGVTDLDVELDAPEMPALDGSALPYALAVQSAGFRNLGSLSVELFERVFLVDGETRVAISRGDGHWRYEFLTGDRWPHSQQFEGQLSAELFLREVAPARTFAFSEEVEPLRAGGLGQGLDDRSALVLGEKGFENTPLWEDEPARHKLLDLMGDLYLCGVPPQCLNVVAVRSGHRVNVEAAKRLADHITVTVDA